MADGVFTATKTSWGLAVSVTGGTVATTLVVLPKGNSVNVKGLYMHGEATTDIFTIMDGSGNIVAKVASGTKSDIPKSVPLYGVRLNGIQLTHGGVTSTGLMSIFLE
jgi:hypothetical protein